MAEPRRDPETGGRSLAEILREAGVDSPTRTGRRRRIEDPDDTGIRQRRADPEADRDRGRGYGRRAGDLRVADASPARAGGPARDPSTAAIPGVRPSGKPGVPGAAGATATGGATGGATATGAVRDRRGEDRRGEDRRGEDRRGEDSRPAERRSLARSPEEPRPDAGRTVRTGDTGRVGPTVRTGDTGRVGPAVRTGDTGRVGPAVQLADNPATGPIPVVSDDLEDAAAQATPRESALAWLRFAGELVIALAAGVGIYFLFTVIWEMVPRLAVLVAPLAVTALVVAIGAYRQRVGRGPVGPKLLAVLVFAGTLLTVAPAAGLLAAG